MKADLTQKLLSLNVDAPHLIYVEDILENNITHIKKSNTSNVDLAIYYSVKACYHPEILKIFKKNGLGFEVMSEMELNIVSSIDQSQNKVIANGIGRSIEYLEKAYLNDHVIIIDSLGDLARLDSLTQIHGKKCVIGIRINSGDQTDSSNAKFIFTKLGIIPFSDEYFLILDKIQENKYYQLQFIHTHNSINAYDAGFYQGVINDVANVYDNIREKYRINSVTTIDIGGGFAGNGYEGSNVPFEQIFSRFREKLPGVGCAIEPGRNLVNSAGFMLTNVSDIKRKPNKTYVFVAATTNVLIPIPTAQYSVLHPAADAAGFECSFVDGILSPNNIIIDSHYLNVVPNIGDPVIISNCGAYTSAMGAFWGFDLIPVSLMKSNGDIVPILTREAINESRRLLINC